MGGCSRDACGPGADPDRCACGQREPDRLEDVRRVLSGGQPIASTGYLGCDAAGVVDEVGEGVTDVSVGDDVFGKGDNTQAEYAVLNSWAAKPASIDWAVAAAAGVAGETGERGFACSTSRPATRSSSTVARAVWGRSPCRWRWPEARG